MTTTTTTTTEPTTTTSSTTSRAFRLITRGYPTTLKSLILMTSASFRPTPKPKILTSFASGGAIFSRRIPSAFEIEKAAFDRVRLRNEVKVEPSSSEVKGQDEETRTANTNGLFVVGRNTHDFAAEHGEAKEGQEAKLDLEKAFRSVEEEEEEPSVGTERLSAWSMSKANKMKALSSLTRSSDDGGRKEHGDEEEEETSSSQRRRHNSKLELWRVLGRRK